MNISIPGFRKIKSIVRRTGVRVVITERAGLPFFLYRYRKRKIFFASAAGCLLLIFVLSRFVWSIDIQGNLTRTDETLLKFLSTKHVYGGMRLSEVDCPQIVKDIRKEYDDIIWVSASVEGTKLIVQVKENEDSNLAAETTGEGTAGEETAGEGTAEEKAEQPTDIVAERDCTITSLITRHGIPLVKEGSKVKKGDILVSGQVPVMNDSKEIQSYQYQQSDADIRGQAKVSYADSQSLTREKKNYQQSYRGEVYLRVSGYRFSLGNMKKKTENCEIHQEEVQLKLSDSFPLPVAVGKRRMSPYKTETINCKKTEIQQILSRRFARYCDDLEKKGVEIIGNDVKIYTGSKTAEAKGIIIVDMPVGEKKDSEIIEIPEKEEKTESTGEE